MDLPRRLRRSAPSLLLVASFLALPTLLQAQAQASTGVIRGKVTDSTGMTPVAQAIVTLRNRATNAERVLNTNTSGVYVATLLQVGTYDLRARALGFREARRDSVPVRLGESVDVNFLLAPQAVQLQELTVSAEPTVDVNSSESATRLSAEAVEGLPNNGRNVFNFATLTPNVATVQGPDGDELSIGGQRGIHNNVSVDGADFNNPFFGEQRGGQRPAFTFNLDAVKEIVVVADGANAEFGRSMSGFVNVITKSGTNDLDGTVHMVFKNDSLSSRAKQANGTLAPKFDSSQVQTGFTVGGPLQRDRLFFFGALDYQRGRTTKQT